MADTVQKIEQQDNRPPIVVLRDKLMARQGELRAALTDVSVESFIRAVMTSVALNPDILGCNWQSIWNACLRSCRDGLLPDGVDAALVPYKGVCNYIPMYQGLLRRFRRSGNFKWITAGIVHQGEEFSHYIDQDGEHFKHVPGDDFAAPIVKIYALATTKDGGVFVAVMPIEEANKIRAMSKATRDDSPWRMWESEMLKKTALRRLSKMLPSARDIISDEPPEAEQTATLVSATDDLPRITGQQERRPAPTAIGSTPKAALDHFAGEQPEPEPEQPEPVIEQAKQAPPPDVGAPGKDGEPWPPGVTGMSAIGIAHQRGKDARAEGIQRRALPGEYRDAEHQDEAAAWLAGWDGHPMPKG
jgi:recombination protein RecT